MTDPLEILREPAGPAAPDPAFALRLRARLERALELPRGVVVSTATIRSEPAVTTDPASQTLGAAIPYLAVPDGRAAIAWYVNVLGAVLDGDPIVMPDGRIGHAELALAGGKLYLADEFPDIGVVAPRPGEASVSLALAVTDVDARVAAATESGGRLVREISEAYGSRNATIIDPFGHRWMLQQALNTVPATEAPPAPWHQGDIGYVSIWTPDLERAATFYAGVLGWTYAHPEPQGRQIVEQSMAMGLYGDRDRPNLFCAYVVGDVDAAAARVRAAGGTASSPVELKYGRVSDCVDPEGTHFAVYTCPSEPGLRSPLNGERHGDLSYVTFNVANSEGARAFYSAVLGWEYTPGRIDDGWQVNDIQPMSGLAGGFSEPVVRPMWRVDDIAAAVARVRAAGGTATDPEEQPYGLSSECVDDQGMAFYLGQH